MRTVIVYLLALAFADSTFSHEATDDEVRAAIGRAHRAAYLVEVAQACGLPSSRTQYAQVKRAAMLLALERTEVGSRLTDKQAEHIISRASAGEVLASHVARAKERAQGGECNNPQLAEAWAAMVRQADDAQANARRKHVH